MSRFSTVGSRGRQPRLYLLAVVAISGYAAFLLPLQTTFSHQRAQFSGDESELA